MVPSAASRYQLVQTAQRLELQDTADPKAGAVYVDFVQGKARHRLKFGGGKGQAIARAIGLRKRPDPLVVDATAGMGREAFVLASLGCRVKLLERNQQVHALLADGLQRALACGEAELVAIIHRMELRYTDARQWLAQLDTKAFPDVIYLDPMFPERRKSARVQKEMQFFHEIVGNDPDVGDLLSIARYTCKHRVVVKRPRLAPVLTELKPDFVINGKTTRYDVYLPVKRG